jgi:hypothetical protein
LEVKREEERAYNLARHEEAMREGAMMASEENQRKRDRRKAKRERMSLLDDVEY